MSVPTPHIGAQRGEIAELVLMPGDPLRAQFIAQKYLQDAHCYNTVRNMLGFTGTYNGVKISVQSHGMGAPSVSIYATELFRFHGVKSAIRIGSAGSIQDNVNLGDIVMAMSACSGAATNSRTFQGIDFAPTANFELLSKSHSLASVQSATVHVGSILTSDSFYDEVEGLFETLAQHKVLAVEMETAALYTVAAKHDVDALSMVTISDHIFKDEAMDSATRELGFSNMVELALATLVSR